MNYKILNHFERKSILTNKLTKYVKIEVPNENVKVNNIPLKVTHIYEALDPDAYNSGKITNYWEPINNSNINIKRNFDEYRKKQNLMMPQQIQYLRKNIYNLNQRELATVLGLGYATISKIENNRVVQSVSQDSALRLLLNPDEMVNLIKDRLPVAKESPLISVKNIKRKIDFNLKRIVLKCISIMANAIRQYVLGKNIDDLCNPININQKIEKVIGVKIIYTNESVIDGFVKWNEETDRPEIIISREDSPYRQRFTIAHELGHLFIHKNWFPMNKSQSNSSSAKAFSVMYRGYPGTSNNYKEKQANEFAADFLMPKDGIQKLYQNATNKDPDVLKYDVSKRYKVSEDAAYHRIKNLKNRNVL